MLLGSGGAAAVLLSGFAPAVQARTTSAQSAPDSVFDLLPAPSELAIDYDRLVRMDLESVEDADELTFNASIVQEIDGISAADADAVVTARDTDQGFLSAISGSFDRVEMGETVEERGDWRIADASDKGLAITTTSGLLVAAQSEDAETRVDMVETATEVARSDGETALETVDLLERAYDEFGDARAFYFIPTIDEMPASTIPDAIQTLSAGFEEPPTSVRGQDGTLENEFMLEADPDADLDDETVEEIIREIEIGTVIELDIDLSGDIAFVETVVEAPPERSRENSPDANITMDANPDEGTAVLTHESGESIPATDLELWVNGEFIDEQPFREFSEFASGDSFTVDTGPLANVNFRWVDEEANEYFDYVNNVVGRDAFDVSHDFGAETVEITYTASTDAPVDLLDLTYQTRSTEDGQTTYEREQLTAPLEALGDRLTSGDTIVVEDVTFQDSMVLELDIPSKPSGFGPSTTLVRYYARPPQFFLDRRPGEQPVAIYQDDTARDADSFRILVDGSEADVQPTDQFDTLEEGDRLQLGDIEFGSKLVIEWVGDDGESFVVNEHVVTPIAQFDITYDDSAGEVTVEHVNGESVDADALEILFDGEQAPTQPGDEYDTVATGDSITASADPFTTVVVRWTDGDTSRVLTEQATGRELFAVSYDPGAETVELTYTGQQSADPSQIGVERFGAGSVNDEPARPFEDDYETLTEGDSATLEGVTPDMLVRVLHLDGQDEPQVLLHFRPRPTFAFSFETKDDSLVATYRGDVARDASEFRFLADGEETDVQPDDEYDTLEAGDTIELGSFEPGTTIVIEWPTSNEPKKIDQHVVTPSADFDASYDDSEGVLRIEHTGGDEIKAADLGIYAPPPIEDLMTWGQEGTVSEGDTRTVEVDEKPDVVIVVYQEREALAEIPLGASDD